MAQATLIPIPFPPSRKRSTKYLSGTDIHDQPTLKPAPAQTMGGGAVTPGPAQPKVTSWVFPWAHRWP